MYDYLNGKLAKVEPGVCVVDCQGVGYRLTVSLVTSDKLSSSEGSSAKLYTYLAVREDGIELFGFGSEEERHAFNMLTSVSGVGPKAALNILSILTPDRLAIAICSDDAKAISKAQNVGAKTAARIILELKDKVAKGPIPAATGSLAESVSPGAVMKGNLSEAAEALAVLGYDKTTINKALTGINPTLDTGAIIKEALKKLSR
jgi:Holliday junction DNA helicase RuvA